MSELELARATFSTEDFRLLRSAVAHHTRQIGEHPGLCEMRLPFAHSSHGLIHEQPRRERTLRKLLSFRGRASRTEYWGFFLVMTALSVGIGVIEGLLGLSATFGAFGALTLPFMLATLVPSVALGVRRLRDAGRSAWWMMIALVPMVGAAVLVFFLSSKSNRAKWCEAQ